MFASLPKISRADMDQAALANRKLASVLPKSSLNRSIFL
jgi:hypothetical protein